MYPQGPWKCHPPLGDFGFVVLKYMYVHMYVQRGVRTYVCIYVSKSNEGSQLIYIQPWAQGCRGGGWPLRGVRGCRHKALNLMRYVHTYLHMNVPKLEMVSSSFPPYICNLYLCMYVCVHVGTPEGGLCIIPPRTPGVPCTPEDFG